MDALPPAPLRLAANPSLRLAASPSLRLTAALALALSLACGGGDPGVSPAPPATAPTAAPAGSAPASAPAAGSAPAGSAPAAQANSPSFDCAKASTPTEKRICASAELSGLDRELAAAWKAANAAHPEQKDALKTQQRQWLKANSACADDPCLADRYRERIGFLKGVASLPGSGGGVTGTWQDGMNTIAILQKGDTIEYSLQAIRELSEDNVHMGYAHGIAPLKGGVAVSKPDDGDGSCTLTFTFKGADGAGGLTLGQDGADFACGFGAGVYADGDYTRVNRAPDMSTP